MTESQWVKVWHPHNEMAFKGIRRNFYFGKLCDRCLRVSLAPPCIIA